MANTLFGVNLDDLQAQIGGLASTTKAAADFVGNVAQSYAKVTNQNGVVIGVSGATPPGGYGDSNVQTGPPASFSEWLKRYWGFLAAGLALLLGGAWLLKKK